MEISGSVYMHMKLLAIVFLQNPTHNHTVVNVIHPFGHRQVLLHQDDNEHKHLRRP